MTMAASDPNQTPEAPPPPAGEQRIVTYDDEAMATGLSLLHDVSLQEARIIIGMASELQAGLAGLLQKRVNDAGAQGEPGLKRERAAQALTLTLWMRSMGLEKGSGSIGTMVPRIVGKTSVALELAERDAGVRARARAAEVQLEFLHKQSEPATMAPIGIAPAPEEPLLEIELREVPEGTAGRQGPTVDNTPPEERPTEAAGEIGHGIETGT